MTCLDELYLKMVDYYADDPARIQHFVKVHSFAALIGRQEGLDPQTQQTLEAAALVASRYRKKLEAGRRDLVVAALMRRGFAYAVIKEAIKRIEEE